MRYLLFGSSDFYYARGGGHDFLGCGDSIDSLVSSEAIKQTGGFHDIVWWHIFDTLTREIAKGTEQQPYGAENIKGGVK